MKKHSSIIALLSLSLFLFSACGTENKVERKIISSAKEVEIFDIKKDKPELSFTTTATVSSDSIVYIMPQTSGKIMEIKAKLGDTVKKYQTLIVLGDSLATDIAEIQYESAEEGLEKALESKNLTNQTAKNTVITAQFGVQTAKSSYENALKGKENYISTFEDQLDNANLGLDNAKDGYKTAKRAYNDMQDAIDDIEDEIDDLEDELAYLSQTDPRRITIEATLDGLYLALDKAETQESTVKMSKDAAENGVKMAENGIDLLEKGYESQLDQIQFGIETAYNQYQIALKQFENAANGADLQNLAAESQIIQAEAAKKSAELSNAQRFLKAPINGKITSISAESGNLTSPGQILMKIENSKSLIIKTSVNQNEAKLLLKRDEVQVIGDAGETTGEIISISTSLNDITKKIDIEIQVDKVGDLTPGEFVKIKFSPNPQTKIYVPLNSVQNKEGKKYVMTATPENKAQEKEVETGEIFGMYIEITKGLSKTDKVILAGTSFIENNDDISIKK
ncbi:MAG: efflux RND transporter periplasmic adaptor subunit [Candidatus Gracilibacteria bacterium]|jgi:RND family efflux transporter MFP subunit